MDATAEGIIARLEASNYGDLPKAFSSYLSPLSSFSTFDSKSKRRKNKSATTTTPDSSLRSLAKQFLPFLCRALSLLPKRLSVPPKSPIHGDDPTFKLFDSYRLCIQCVGYISSQLSSKPNYLQAQRLRMIHCLISWEIFDEALTEGIAVLKSLDNCNSRCKRAKSDEILIVPEFKESCIDRDFGLLVVETAVIVVKCAALIRRKDADCYRRVSIIAEEVTPWFKVLDANCYEQFHRVFVTYLKKITLFMAEEFFNFDVKLVVDFCSLALNQYAISPIKDRIMNFAGRICWLLFSCNDHKSHNGVISTVGHVFETIVHLCNVEEEDALQFVEMVSYCANQCLFTNNNELCKGFSVILNRLSDILFMDSIMFSLILRFYGRGLLLADCSIPSIHKDPVGVENKKDKSKVYALVNNGDIFLRLSSLGQVFESFSVDYVSDSSEFCRNKKKNEHITCYMSALRFFSKPLYELVNSHWEHIVDVGENVPFASVLSDIQKVLNHFFDVFLLLDKWVLEKEGDKYDMRKAVLSVSVALYTISVRTKVDVKKNVMFVKNVISCGWVQPQGLKFIFVSLHNAGVVHYRKKQLKEAYKVVKLCCRASWRCVELLCKMIAEKEFNGDFSEKSVVDFASEAASKGAFLLDIIYQCGRNKLNKAITYIFEIWGFARAFWGCLPIPIPLVKQWVRINCKIHSESNVVEENAHSLYHLLPSSIKVSTNMVGSILEKEFQTYTDMAGQYPGFCHQMQMKVINILLESVYHTEETFIQRSDAFIRKARILKSQSSENMQECTDCLSLAISAINSPHIQPDIHATQNFHQLATAHCLRALCEVESEPKSERIFQDIKAAISIWLNSDISGDLCGEIQSAFLPLFHILDLLSIQGCSQYHCDIYRLIIRLWKSKNLDFESILAVMWENRRLTHALCSSPIGEVVLINLVELCGEKIKSVELWMSSLEGFQPLQVGFELAFSFSPHVKCPDSLHQNFFQPEIATDKCKKVVSNLVSCTPLYPKTASLAGNLLYDIAQSLVCRGKVIEALSHASGSLALRTKLLQKNFTYSIEMGTEKFNEIGVLTQKRSYAISKLKVRSLVVADVWSCKTTPWDFETSPSTPWNVLQCYLESTLQVGIIHDMLGNESEAEVLFLSGKNISSTMNLPIFTSYFCYALGKFYYKKRVQSLAKQELLNARKSLDDKKEVISCSKCRILLEVTIDQKLGDLSGSSYDYRPGFSSPEKLSHAEYLYRSALEKLDSAEWINSISYSEDKSHTKVVKARKREPVNGVRRHHVDTAPQITIPVIPYNEVPTAKLKARKPGKVSERKVQLVQYSQPETDLSKTCSRLCSKNTDVVHDTLSGSSCSCLNWNRLPLEILRSGMLDNFIRFKLEFVRRRLLTRLLTSLGRFLEIQGEIHAANDMFLRSMQTIVCRNAFYDVNPSPPSPISVEFFGKHIHQDMLLLEHAYVLYHICCFSLKNHNSKDSGMSTCSSLLSLKSDVIISWLVMAFIACREVPVLFQKISKLLAVVILYQESNKSPCFPFSSSDKLSQSHWVAYFHQASLGVYLNHKMLSNMSREHKEFDYLDVEDSLSVPEISDIKKETCNILRSAPESSEELETFALSFFKAIPCTTVCISFLEKDLASLLTELLCCTSPIDSWILVSRMNSNDTPIVVLLPVDSILEDDSDDRDASSLDTSHMEKSCSVQWNCPWDFSIIDDIVPMFKHIMENNHISSSKTFTISDDMPRKRSSWWNWRRELDQHLGKLLNKMEESWFGPWKYLLLGESSDNDFIETAQNKLIKKLKTKSKRNVNESVVKTILCAASDFAEQCVSQNFLEKGCCIDWYRLGEKTNKSDSFKGLPKSTFKLIHEAMSELEERGEAISRGPVILVFDREVQMIPWESMPILRKQEVYRMPSVGSILAMIHRGSWLESGVGTIRPEFPLIDPMDAFYLLNPSGDLSSTQLEFEEWFKGYNLEGRAGVEPTQEELTSALKNHNLFMYFGHGSGGQYIPGNEIRKLGNCAAMLLMGCSSGTLSFRGCYSPRGAPLDYLLAGSPFIVSNLWDVTDKDIDRFSKVVIDGWLRERELLPTGLDYCFGFAEELTSLSIDDEAGCLQKKIKGKKITEDHRNRVGSFIGQARESCLLPFLIGASPVCYGVPTGIWRRR